MRYKLLLGIICGSLLLTGCSVQTGTGGPAPSASTAYPNPSASSLASNLNGTIKLGYFSLPPTPTPPPATPPPTAPPTQPPPATPPPTAPPTQPPSQCTMDPSHDADDAIVLGYQNASRDDVDAAWSGQWAYWIGYFGQADAYDLLHNIVLPDFCQNSCDVTDLLCPAH